MIIGACFEKPYLPSASRLKRQDSGESTPTRLAICTK